MFYLLQRILLFYCSVVNLNQTIKIYLSTVFHSDLYTSEHIIYVGTYMVY